jgi:hypothetical protein
LLICLYVFYGKPVTDVPEWGGSEWTQNLHFSSDVLHKLHKLCTAFYFNQLDRSISAP